MTTLNWGSISSMLVLFGTAILVVTVASLIKSSKKDLLVQVMTALGGLGGLAAVIIYWHRVSSDGAKLSFADTVRIDHLALFIIGVISSIVFLSALTLKSFFAREKLFRAVTTEIYVLILLSATGGAIMASANDLIVLFMGLEVLSLAAYILAASNIRKAQSQESGMKYFVIGAFASGFFLYGIALIYGATGSTKLAQISQKLVSGAFVDDGFLLGGIALFLVGLLFKVSAVPFHVWTPDVYEGAPSPFVAFMSSAVKVAGFVALIRVLGGALIESAADWQPIIYAVSIASMAVGTLAALVQTNVKRILAYSSIAHAGYILIGIQAATKDGFAASLWYLAIYAMLAFASFSIVAAREGAISGNSINDPNHIDNYRGLASKQPFLAVIFAILLLAQAGVPPTSGFYAKFSVISAVVDARSYPLAIVAMIIAVAAAFIYIRLLIVMFFTPADSSLLGGATMSKTAFSKTTSKTMSPITQLDASENSDATFDKWKKLGANKLNLAVLTLAAAFTIAMGVYPAPLLELAQSAAQSLV